MSAAARPDEIPDSDARRLKAAQLRERIYLTFTALAVVLALSSHGEIGPLESIATLAVTILGVLLAIFVADIVGFTVAHERVMTKVEYRHAVASSFGALGAVASPFVLLGLAALGLWETSTALLASAIALVAALIVIGWLAVRKIEMRWWERLLALGAEATIALVVIGLQLLAHS